MLNLFVRLGGFHVAMDEKIVDAAENDDRARQPESDAMELALHELFVLATILMPTQQRIAHQMPEPRTVNSENKR